MDPPSKKDQIYLLLFEPGMAELLYVLLTEKEYSAELKEKILKVSIIFLSCRVFTHVDSGYRRGEFSVFECLFVCTISQKPARLGSPNWHIIVPRWVPETKVKVVSHYKCVSVFRQNAVLPLATYVSHAGFSVLHCPTVQAILATLGFPCVTSLRPMLSPTAGVSVCGIFCSQPVAKTLLAWSWYRCECCLLLHCESKIQTPVTLWHDVINTALIAIYFCTRMHRSI